ncbi:PRC-barrel domain-containing protein [Saccharothrix sp. BKS2]|uniref:PRC-barrel domain-containing protein n=1 Tax=Saccharothrix sp. BKS2 TaxID=3064400 RepID=UPI0039E86598
MSDQAEVDRLYECEVIDERGERIGAVKQIWLDDRDGRPVWASVHTGLLGLRETFVPIRDATVGTGTITVPLAKRTVRGAPRIDVSDQHMSREQQDELCAYYDLTPDPRGGDHDRLERPATDDPGRY